MKKFIRHLFLPHHTNNQRAKILHHSSILFVAGFFILQAFLFSTIQTTYPRVLGASIDLSSQDLLLLTNQKRAEAGVGPLILNDKLTQAAQAKAVYMFAQDFWAHNAPDGTTPWDFVKKTGYPYVYAGENLARGFTNTPDVIDAWMASPEHRDNMLSANYKDIGFAVKEGNLTGEKNTVLIVEMFGNTTATPVAKIPENQHMVTTVLSKNVSPDSLVAAIKYQPWIDSTAFVRDVSVFFLSAFLLVLFMDIVIVKRKRIVRVFEHTIDHVMFLGTILIIVCFLARGAIY